MRGHIRKRGRKWCYVVDLGRGESGKRQQQWKGGFASREEAERELTDVLGKIDRKEYVEPSKLTVKQFLLDEWLVSVESSLRMSTFSSYKMLVDKYLVPAIGGTRLQALTPAKLNATYRKLLTTGGREGRALSPRTIRYAHAVLRRSLEAAVRWGYVQRNVAALADPPKSQRGTTMRTWTPEQLRTFLTNAQAHDERFFAGWLLYATTGMRRGELLGLRRGDVDLDASRARIRQAIVLVDGKVIVSTPKTDGSIRQVALDPETVSALRAHLKARGEERMALGLGKGSDEDLVFCSPTGEPLQPDRVFDRFKSLAKQAGLPAIRLHDMRHTYATLALEAGIHPKIVSERLGHANIKITLDTYSHAIPAMDADAATKVARLIFGN